MASTIFNIEGGLGKHIASTAVIKAYKKQHKDRKIIVVGAWPEVFLRNNDITRFYRQGNVPYFYEDFIFNKKDLEIFAQDPYRQKNHITKKTHLIKTWCDMVGVKYNHEPLELNFNIRELEEANTIVHQLLEPVRSNGKPLLIFQPFGGPGPPAQQNNYSWTRDLHPNAAQHIVDQLKDKYNILHICYEFHPTLNNVIRFHNVVSKKVLCAMLHSSQKRLFVDSSLQHAAAAMNLPSTVVWVATQHKIFGYGLHDNIGPKSQNLRGTVDSYLYDYSFNGVTHECPYNDINQIHKIDDIIASVNKS